MKNKIVEFPFQEYFLDFRKKRSKAEKIHVFKNWLESYVKFNLAIHVSWILKHKQQNVPINLRVMLVQLFQKPPSIGFCFSIGKFINKELLGDSESDSMWYRWAFWMEQREQNVSRLIELRNKDAHTGASLSDTELLEIEEILQVLLSNPILSNAALVVTSAKGAIRAGIQIPDGMEGLKIPIVLLKEGQFFIDEDIILEGNELPLFPILAAVKIEVTGAVDLEIEMSNENDEVIDKRSVNVSVFDYPLVFWNKRISNKGLYSCYLKSGIPDAEVNNITNLSGFPYEDWKRSANPIFLKYLESRDRAMEDMLNDDAVNIDEWYNEYLVAKRLEKEIELKEYEKITHSDYVKGILQKLNNVTDKDVLELYHKRIVELQKAIDQLPEWERRYLAEKIMDSLIFMFNLKVEAGDLEKYNFYYNSSIKFIPVCFYQNINPTKPLLAILGGEKIFNRIFRRMSWLTRLFIFISLLLCVIFYLNISGWYLCSTYTILFCIIIYFIKQTQKKYTANLINNKIQSVIFLRRRVFRLIMNLYKGLESNLLDNVTSENLEFSEVMTVNVNDDLIDFEKRSFWSKVSYVTAEKSDFIRICLRYKFLQKVLDSSKDKILGEHKDMMIEYLTDSLFTGKPGPYDSREYDFSTEDRLRYMNAEFEYSSDMQRRYLFKKLNGIVYLENIMRCIDMVRGNRQYSLSSSVKVNERAYKVRSFDLTFYQDTIAYSEDYSNHNYLLGFIAAYLGELEKASIFFKNAYESSIHEHRIYRNMNLAQVYGAMGLVKMYMLTYMQLHRDLNSLSEGQKKRVMPWIFKDVQSKVEWHKKILNDRSMGINELPDKYEIESNSIKFKNNSEFILNFPAKYLPKELHSIKLTYSF